MKADMEIADQMHQWFKFMLHYEGGQYKPLDHTLYTSQKFISRSLERDKMESKVVTTRIPLNYRVESKFRGEFVYEPNPIFHKSDIEQCFGPFLYPPPGFKGPPYLEDSQFYYDDSDNDDLWEYL